MQFDTLKSYWGFSVLFALVFAAEIQSQIAYEQGAPPSWSMEKSLVSAQSIRLPSSNLEAFRQEDAINDLRKDIPYRFAVPHVVDLNTSNAGTWSDLTDGNRLWRLELRSPGALSLNVIFNEFVLSAGAEMYLYSPDHSQVLGPFTHRNNLPEGSLATSLIEGEAIVVEYFVSARQQNTSRLSIGQVSHGYRGLNSKAAGYGDSGPCNNNTVCTEWNDWRCQIKSEVLLLSGGSSFCTGTLLNNTSQDGTPIVLTANHCTGSSVTNWVFMFNWESPTCDPTTNASKTQTVSGATLLAKNAGSDFSLVKMSDKPPANYNAYYAGWDATGDAVTSEVGIHHPAGDIKKISLDKNAAKKSTWSSAQVWSVVWEDGTTEPGSSGSGLFDQNHRLIGQLYGGQASCDNQSGSDNYGRLEISWGLGASQHLDPGNTGLKKIEGLGTGACAGNAIVAGFAVGAKQSCDGNVTFADQSTNATAWNWDFGDGGTATIKNPSHSYATSGTFNVKLIVEGAGGVKDTLVKPVTTTRLAPVVATGDSVCQGKTGTLKANASAGVVVNWYTAATGGNLIGTGSQIATPVITAATTFYAEAVEDKPTQKVGPTNNTFGAGSYYTSSTTHGEYFTVITSGVLRTVKTYANTAAKRTVELQDDSLNVVASATVDIPQGESRITLNFNLKAGNYFLKIADGNTVDLYRNTAGASYPYSIPGLVSITKSSSGNGALTYFYYFYDWEVQGEVCRTARTPVAVALKTLGCGTGIAAGGNHDGFSLFSEISDGALTVYSPLPVGVDIVNLTGEVVQSLRLSVGTNRIDIRSMQNGIYFLKTQSATPWIRQFVKGE